MKKKKKRKLIIIATVISIYNTINSYLHYLTIRYSLRCLSFCATICISSGKVLFRSYGEGCSRRLYRRCAAGTTSNCVHTFATAAITCPGDMNPQSNPVSYIRVEMWQALLYGAHSRDRTYLRTHTRNCSYSVSQGNVPARCRIVCVLRATRFHTYVLSL